MSKTLLNRLICSPDCHGTMTKLNRAFHLIKSGRAHRSIGRFPSVKQSFAARRTIV